MEGVGVSRCRISRIVEVIGIAAVLVVFKMPQVVSLDQGQFIVGVACIGGQTLVVTVTQFINMPNGDACSGQAAVPAGLLPVFKEIIFCGDAGLLVAVKGVVAAGRRCGQGGGAV